MEEWLEGAAEEAVEEEEEQKTEEPHSLQKFTENPKQKRLLKQKKNEKGSVKGAEQDVEEGPKEPKPKHLHKQKTEENFFGVV